MHVDFTMDQDKLMSNSYIVKCLSIQAALGFKSTFQRRELTSSVPWIALNLRNFSMMVTYFMQFNRGPKGLESHDAGG